MAWRACGPIEANRMRAALIVLLMLATTPAWAEWVKLSENDKAAFYFDPATIGKDGNTRRVLALQDLKARDLEGNHSRQVYFEYRCEEERYRMLFFSLHSGPMATGDILFSKSDPTEWDNVAAGTAGKVILKHVCAR